MVKHLTDPTETFWVENEGDRFMLVTDGRVPPPVIGALMKLAAVLNTLYETAHIEGQYEENPAE